MYDIDKMPSSIDVGYTGETNFNSIQINMAPWVSKVPGGSPKILYMRPGESEASLATTTFENNVLTWSITDDVLGTKEGTGLFQVWFADTDEEEELRKLGMSVVVSMIIHLSIAGEGGNAYTVQLPWLKEIMDLKNIILGYDYEAEAWAVGQSGGVDVPSTNPAYNNHAKHYSEEAAKWATGGTTGTPGAENNAKYYSEQADAAKAAAQTAQAACEAEVTRQLSEIISNPDSPPLDRTLSSNVSAAPADMVGNLKSAFLRSVNDSRFFTEQGNIKTTDGSEEYLSNRIRTGFIRFNSYPATVTASNGYQFRYITYNSDFEIGTNSTTWETSRSFSNASLYLRFVVRKTSDGTITPDEILSALNLGSNGAYCTVLDEQIINRMENSTSENKKYASAIANVFASYSERGGIATATGLPTDDDNRIRSGYLKPKTIPQTITAASGYKFHVFIYNDDMTLSTYATAQTSYTINTYNWIRVVAYKSSNADIKISEFASAFSSSFSNYEREGTIHGVFNDKEDKIEAFEFSLENRQYTPIELRHGYYIPLNGTDIGSATENGSYNYIIIRSEEGDRFILNATGGQSPRAYGFVRADGHILEAAEQSKTYRNALITAPQNTAFLVINNSGTGTSYKINETINKEETGIKDFSEFGNIGFNANVTPALFIYSQTTRISNGEYIYFDIGDIIQIAVGSAYQYVVRMYEGTLQSCVAANYEKNGVWTNGNATIVAPCNGFLVIMFADASDRTESISVSDFDGNIKVIEKNHADTFASKKEFDREGESGAAYSWWVTNRTVDSYGNLYFGYVSKAGFAGVGCKMPDGMVIYKDLWKATNCNDHNAPSVNIMTKDGEQYVAVIGATGQGGDNIMHVCIAKKPNTVRCNFDYKPYAIQMPEGYYCTMTYSQAFINGANIYNVINLHQVKISPYTDIVVKVCMKSDDYGETWSMYRVYYDPTQSRPDYDYLWLADVEGSASLKRVLVSHNPSDGYYPISTGFIDFATNKIYNGSMTDIEKPITIVGSGELPYEDGVTIAGYSDFTVVVEPETGYRTRPLDLFETSDSHLIFLYCKAASANSDTDFILFRYEDGVTTEISHLGRPFFIPSSYVTGANFMYNTDRIVYAKNDSGVTDGPHTLHLARLENNAVVSDKIIKITSMCIARPMRFKKEGLMYMIGKYYAFPSAGDFLTWAFNIGFVEAT